MTQLEKQTLEKLNSKLDLYIAEDKAWKAEFTAKLDPLVGERNERIILQNAGKYVWKGIVAVIVFLGAVGTLIHFAPDLLKIFKH